MLHLCQFKVCISQKHLFSNGELQPIIAVEAAFEFEQTVLFGANTAAQMETPASISASPQGGLVKQQIGRCQVLILPQGTG